MNIIAVVEQPSPAAGECARLLGWPVAVAPAEGQAALLIRDRFDANGLRACLSPPWVGALEVEGSTPLRVGSCFRRHLAEGGFGLSLRTDTAYEAELSAIFSEALAERLLAPGADTAQMEFVIHEMIANALLHGNLAVGGIDTDDGGGLDGFAPRIDGTLADPALAGRRIQLSASLVGERLEVAVEDEGSGFDYAIPDPNQHRPHGLALVETMVDELRLEEGGRRTVAAFIVPARQRHQSPLGLDGVRVLVVDDTLLNRVLLETLLLNMGVGHVEQAESGIKGLEAIERAKPDLVLLDVMMPGMDGFEMCRKLRLVHPLTELPVIFVTALDSPADRAACFTAGGSDMVTKPIDVNEVMARVGVHLRLGQAMNRLRGYQDRVNEELQTARSALLALMPTLATLAVIRQRTGLVVDGRIETSSELGGDFWTILPAGPRQLMLLVADFTGHGPAAAFNVFRLHLLLSRLPRQMPGPSALLGRLNLDLKSVLRPGQFACAFAALLDLDAGTLTYSGAASPPPVLVRDGHAVFLDTAGAPLGAFADAEYDEECVDMPPGAALLAYSDALVESLDRDGLPACDQESLRDWVLGVGPDASLADEVLARFRERVPGEPPDDLTLVSLRRPIGA